MKGYRTILFSALMTLAGMIGWKINPAAANNWVDVFVAFWGIGSILLRQITTTPVGNPALLAGTAALLSDSDMVAVRTDLQTVLGHVSMTPVLAAAVGNISDKFDLVAAAIQAVAANAAAPQVTPIPAAGEIVPAGQVVPAPIGDGASLTPPPIGVGTT
jgi:hypothetical protein